MKQKIKTYFKPGDLIRSAIAACAITLVVVIIINCVSSVVN